MRLPLKQTAPTKTIGNGFFERQVFGLTDKEPIALVWSFMLYGT